MTINLSHLIRNNAIPSNNKKGLVVAFHCVPFEVDQEIENFWSHLKDQLQLLGLDLFLISTAPIHNSTIQNLQIPFNLPDLEYCTENYLIDDALVETVSNWYQIDKLTGLKTFSSCYRFFVDALNFLRPSVVISWQSTHPLSRITKLICQQNDIPWWCAERGWLRNTLMVDLCENNLLSETSRSLALKRSFQRYKMAETLPEVLRSRLDVTPSASRYPSQSSIPYTDLRQSYNLSKNTKIFALMTHGEPHVNSISNYRFQANHGMSLKTLQFDLFELSNELSKTGDVIFIREHPFNHIHNRCLNFTNLKNVYSHTGQLDELIYQADFFLLTLSTLQFELALRGKQFGLLSRSLLSGPDEAPFRGDFSSCNEFLDSFTNESSWSFRESHLLRRIGFLFEYCLLDLQDQAIEASATELAFHFSEFYN